VQDAILEPGKIRAVFVDTMRIFQGEKQVLSNFLSFLSPVS
jgi:hypothetical protein